MTTGIIDDIYIRTPNYGTPFHLALTCLRCGAMVDGGQHTSVSPRQVHTQWHVSLDAEITHLALRGMPGPRAAAPKPPADTSWVRMTDPDSKDRA